VPATEVPLLVQRLAAAHAQGADLLEVGPHLVAGAVEETDVAAPAPSEAA
jgi:hypothetical protein